MKRIKLDKIVDDKYLSFYEATYKIPEKYKYYFVSRRKENEIGDINKVDAVMALTFETKTKDLVFIKEFRYPVNSYVYEFAAGLVDENESPEVAINREIKEELGATVVNLTKIAKSGFTSSGITDETIEVYMAEIDLNGNQNLEKEEKIEIVKVKLENVKNFLNAYPLDIKAAILAKLYLAYNNIF